MKKYLCTLFLLVIMISNAQNLSVTDLMSLRNMTVSDASAYLKNLDWKFDTIQGSETGKLGFVKFDLYSKDREDLILSKIYLSFKSNDIKRLNIGFINTGKFFDFREEIKNLNAKRVDDKKDHLLEIYQNDNSTFVFQLSKETDETFGHKLYYYLSIWSTKDYKYMEQQKKEVIGKFKVN